MAVLTTGPFVWLLATSLKSGQDLFAWPPAFLPRPATLDNYRAIFAALPLGTFLLNSVKLTVLGVALNVATCTLAAYPLARLRFPGRDLVFYALISTMLVPNAAGGIVNFLTLRRLSLLNTLLGVALPSAASVFNIFLLRQAFAAVPRELDEAAVMDGAGLWYRFWRIGLPLVRPALATVVIFDVMGFWNSFLWPLIVLRDPEKYPLAVGLQYLQGEFSYVFGHIAAGAVVAVLPMVVLFLVLQRQFIEGVAGAFKG